MTAPSSFNVTPGGALRGVMSVPGDKSVSHRSVILGSIAEGSTQISGFLEGDDALATMDAFRSMGVSIDGPDAGEVLIAGVGLHGLCAPDGPIDLGNSGTAMRLMVGLLAGQSFDAVLSGDESLNARPMGRVCDPLTSMGACLDIDPYGTPPLHVKGAAGSLRGIDYEMPMASAQVKSSLLLAGLYASGRTCVTEPAPTRDHTERMLRTFGYDLCVDGPTVCLNGGGKLNGTEVSVPGDFSSATFFLVGASIAEDSDLTIKNVGINPTRTGALDILRLMGADISVFNERLMGAEPVADLRVRHSKLSGIEIPRDLVALSIDEFPALFVAAACARGRTIVAGAQELRVKESDRIDAMAQGLAALGLNVKATPDGMILEGGKISGGNINSRGDHRIAMAFAMAGMNSKCPVIITNCTNVRTSFPGFVLTASAAGLRIEEIHA